MADPEDKEKADAVRALAEALLGGAPAQIPTSTLGRLGRTARVAARIGGVTLARRRRGGDESPLAGLDPAAVERLVRSLGELKGIAMKVGQILSYVDDSLPPETRRLLALLQTTSQPTAFAEIERTVRDELGDRASDLLATMDRTPASSASIGQVHRARLPDGTPVAVKVRHPGIERAIRADFRAALPGGAFAGFFVPGADVGEIIEEARARFLEECDYVLEAQRQARFLELHAHSADIRVPAVHDAYCSRGVLTTTWHEGRGFEQLLASAPAAAERDRLGRALYEFYLGTLYRHGLFNADPHPGNLLFETAGERRIVILDYGCVREFDRETVRAVAALSEAVRASDRGAIRDALVQLGARDPGGGKRFDTTHALLRGFFAPVLERGRHRVAAGFSMALDQVTRTKMAAMRLHLPAKLLFLFRIRFGLYAVLARIGAELDWRQLESELAGAALFE